jgi:oligopeptidase B
VSAVGDTGKGGGTARSVPVEPPVAERRPQENRRPDGTVVTDPYAWLRDRDDPTVIAHLEAENAHTESVLAPTVGLQERIFTEIRSRVKETDASAPAKRGDWWYLTRTEEGLSYPIHCRRQGAADGPEEVWLDVNALAEGHDHFSLGGLAVSPDQRLAGYSVDTDGSEIFRLRFRDLETGDDLADEVSAVSYGLAWHSDSRSILYTVRDAAMRPFQVWRHRLGTDASEDELLLEEPDERFHLGVRRTRSGAFLLIGAGSKVTDEVWAVDADDPDAQPWSITGREQGVELTVTHGGDRFWMVTNADGATDFMLVSAPVDRVQAGQGGREDWEVVVPEEPGRLLEAASAFADFLVLSDRHDGASGLVVLDPASREQHRIELPEEVATAHLGRNYEFSTDVIRYGYTSMVTPASAYDHDVRTRERTLVKRQEVLGGFSVDDYRTVREWATAPDGTEVPISIVAHRDVEPDGTNPLVLYGYGAYGHAIDPGFSSIRLSLLDRGVVFAIAHVRGGGALGRRWYLDGKFAQKPNTFTDFLACAEHLVDTGWAAADRLACRGGSAGGLLVGAVLARDPERFRAALAEVPFVDVANTMLDASLPLTVIEYEEWGDPNEPQTYELIRGYAPYEDALTRAESVGDDRRWPALLVTAGLNDPRVGYWEPAKWVAALRRALSRGGPILLETELGAGHGGRSGRYDAWRDEARYLAFLLTQLGVETGDNGGGRGGGT